MSGGFSAARLGQAASASAAPTMQDAWNEVERFRADAEVMTGLYRRESTDAAARGEADIARRRAAIADFHERRQAIMARVCGLIDLAIGDQEIMERLKYLAAERRGCEEAERATAGEAHAE